MSTPHNIIQFGSVVLGGFYLIFLYFGKEWINWLLGIYFSLAGALSVWRVRACSLPQCDFNLVHQVGDNIDTTDDGRHEMEELR
jgi:hypothetical protein